MCALLAQRCARAAGGRRLVGLAKAAPGAYGPPAIIPRSLARSRGSPPVCGSRRQDLLRRSLGVRVLPLLPESGVRRASRTAEPRRLLPLLGTVPRLCRPGPTALHLAGIKELLSAQLRRSGERRAPGSNARWGATRRRHASAPRRAALPPPPPPGPWAALPAAAATSLAAGGPDGAGARARDARDWQRRRPRRPSPWRSETEAPRSEARRWVRRPRLLLRLEARSAARAGLEGAPPCSCRAAQEAEGEPRGEPRRPARIYGQPPAVSLPPRAPGELQVVLLLLSRRRRGAGGSRSWARLGSRASGAAHHEALPAAAAPLQRGWAHPQPGACLGAATGFADARGSGPLPNPQRHALPPWPLGQRLRSGHWCRSPSGPPSWQGQDPFSADWEISCSPSFRPEAEQQPWVLLTQHHKGEEGGACVLPA